MDSLEAFLSIVIICIDYYERGLDYLLRYKYCLSSSPRLCTACRKFSRNIIDILESIVHSYVMRRANSGNTITNDLFELLLDILTDDKYHMVEASFDCIVN